MKICLITFVAFLIQWSPPDNRGTVVLPKEWSKDFIIVASEGGGMIDQEVKATFTFDSVLFERRVEAKKTRKCVRLNNSKRAEILKKLKSFDIERVRVLDASPAMDAGNTDICFTTLNATTCLTRGYATQIHADDVARFSDSYSYLIHYADPDAH